MRMRVFRILTVQRSRFAALCALAAIALLAAAASASAATPLTGEGLTVAGTSTGGGGRLCAPTFAGVQFSASGTASGPYPGSFSETGSLRFSPSFTGSPPLQQFHFNATFTITSGTTTITGSLGGGPGRNGVSGYCNSATGKLTRIQLVRYPVTYTSTINGQTVQSTGTVSGTFYAAAGANDSLSETLQ